MDVLLLSRIQFGLTVGFHFIYPPLSIGMSVVIAALYGLYLKTKDEAYERSADFFLKIFALTFAVGVATGIVMEFEFGTNWATYSRYVGDIFGSPLAAEGVLKEGGLHGRQVAVEHYAGPIAGAHRFQ